MALFAALSGAVRLRFLAQFTRWMAAFALLLSGDFALADDLPSQNWDAYRQEAQPLLVKYCHECHAGDHVEAEVDLSRFRAAGQLDQDLNLWIKTRRMLDSGQMPPRESPQLTSDELIRLRTWVRRYLRQQAERFAGDPGPVILRRLNNEEYNYTIQDLTGIASLNPTREFPVDGAAGEGFINTGSAQSMSPSYVQKYLDAAKEVASHAVLTPEGIEFSAGTSRREWTDERLVRIRNFYDRFTIPTVIPVEVGGTGTVNNDGGAIPLDRYLLAIVEQRDALLSGQQTVATLAAERGLSVKYLGTLWGIIDDPADSTDNALFDWLRHRCRTITSEQVPQLVADISQLQQRLWKFNTIGQLGEDAKQKAWMTPASILQQQQEFRIPLQPGSDGAGISLTLSAHDLSANEATSHAIWQQPRLEFTPDAAGVTQPPLLIRDLSAVTAQAHLLVKSELPRSADYLSAVAESHRSNRLLTDLATERQLDAALLQSWGTLVGLGVRTPREIQGHLPHRITQAQGYAALNGWSIDGMPNMLTNRSESDISFSTLTVPARGVVMHPSPSQESIVAWRSPLSGSVQISGLVADADDKCGNGTSWRLERLTESGATLLASGTFDNGGRSTIHVDAAVNVSTGDIVSLIINARDNSHVCDTTHVSLTLTETEGDKRRWDLAHDVVDHIVNGNPLPDSFGNTETWHFCAREQTGESKSAPLVPESALARWRMSVLDGAGDSQTAALAASLQQLLLTDNIKPLSETDRQQRTQLLDWLGPLCWLKLARNRLPLDAEPTPLMDVPHGFGRHPNGKPVDPASLCVAASAPVTIRIPSQLITSATFVTAAEVHGDSAEQGSLQAHVLPTTDRSLEFALDQPILARTGSSAAARWEANISQFRDLFPTAVCYSRIVPVDEVVTMVLYFREDEHLRRLLLEDSEIAELNRLWDELLYVAQEPIALTVAFEQIYEFATQDRPDLVVAFGPLREPINRRADQFRQRLIASEPAHVEAVQQFAARAWRRDLSRVEQTQLAELYRQLRASEIPHEEATRLLLARVLTSPVFLYRLEEPGSGESPKPVSSQEVATRVSYFLWSSLPDAKLGQAAAADLTLETPLLEQTRRMLKDARSRRLAIQFACQWLHVRDFDQNDDKNEALYPEFAALRGDMYEETVRFFEDMIRNDGSILDLVDADHTFLNEPLARHYGIDGVTGPDWRRVDGIRQHGRGGVFGMATFLASQSGASRTSPILRGNWVYETLLGERLPRPPAGVPQLPESVPTGLTARQLIEMHSSAKACVGCHIKIDPYGFALEQYDAIGRLRPVAVDTKTTLEDGRSIDGLNGLQDYLLSERRDAIVHNFCRKLLGFALGREVQLSDEPLLDTMLERLEAHDYRFSVAVEVIVLSDQFRKIRGREQLAEE
ncbi:MAG: DUF1592 domain-containing protein [Planctomycetaceae bacterium]|nr:DUF1592 domain-containing protein [Planctomycetaceae bacterium]